MKDALAGFVAPDPKKKPKKPSPYLSWRLLVVSPDPKEIFNIRRLFQDRFKVVECAICNTEAWTRIEDQFAPAIELIMVDDRLIDRKSIGEWEASLKAPLKRPNTVLVTNSPNPKIDPVQVAASLGCLGMLDPDASPSEFVKELLISTGHVKYVPNLEEIPDIDMDFEPSDSGILVPTITEEPEVELEIPSLEIPELSIAPAEKTPEPTEPELEIPRCPENLATVLVALNEEDPDLTVINRVLDTDPSFCEVTVRTINSAYYGLETPVESVDHALRMLGARDFRILSHLLAIKRAFTESGVRQSEFAKRVWRHAFASAITCQELATTVSDKWKSISSIDLFKLGLYHNTGMLLIYRKFPRYRDILRERFKADFTGEKQIEWELKKYQMDHAKISADIAKTWGLSDELCEVIQYQAKADKVSHPDDSIVHLASLLSFGDCLGNEYLYPGYSLHGNKAQIDPFLDYLNVNFTEFLQVREQVAERTKRLSYLFNSG